MKAGRFVFVMAVAVAIGHAVPAAASTIALGYSSHSNAFIVDESTPNNQWIAQTFTITSALDISAIEIGLSGFDSDARVELVQGSPGSGTTLLDTTISDTTAPFYASYSVPAAFTLQPDSYYLVLANVGSSNFNWVFGQTAVSSSFGTIGAPYVCLNCNTADPRASAWSNGSPYGYGPTDFRLIEADATPPNGSNAVPEPTTVVLLGSGLLGTFAARRRRRQAR